MSDRHDPFPFPPDDDAPVAEYRDPELARRFADDPVPPHDPAFWDRLELAVAGREPQVLATGPAPLELVGPPARDPRWTSTRWLAAAAVLLAVVGVGGIVLAVANRSASVESAEGNHATLSGDSTSPSTGPASTAPATTTTAPEATTTTAKPSTAAASGEGVDYFGDSAVTGIGRGRAVAFSPDDRAILLVDDAPGVELGCEGAELLALYTQDLATGERRPTLGPGSTIETGGIELLVPTVAGATSATGARPVRWTEYCDGERSVTRRGTLSPDGFISLVEDVETGGSDDPFGRGRVESVARVGGDAVPSADGRFTLRLSAGTVTVTSDGAGDEPAELVAPAVEFGVWAPGGDVVALAGADGVVVWNHRTGESRTFPGARAGRLVFDNQGNRLALVSFDDVATTSVLTFGDPPAIAPAAPRCSGDVDLPPIDPKALGTGGLPPAVVETVSALDAAAATCDWSALDLLAGQDFVASFGGGDPVTLWQAAEAGYGSPMWQLRMVLRQPYGTEGDSEPTIFAWPELFLRQDCDWDEADLRALREMGYGEGDARSDCEALGGYAGYRTGIDRSGTWRYFVAGD